MKLRLLPVFLAVVAIILVARDGFNEIAGNPDSPVTVTPGAGESQAGSALHEARLELAEALDVQPLAIRLVRVDHAGWDGCLGVYEKDALCTQQFIGGYLAFFEHGGKQYRFHFAGDEFIGPIDPAEHARVSDGEPVPYELRADLDGLMAEYARREVALRTGAAPDSVVTLNIIPVQFGNNCQGYKPASSGVACLAKGPLNRGSFVDIEAAGEAYRYSAGRNGVIYFDLTQGEAIESPPQIDVINATEIRKNLATRAGIPLDRVSFQSYRDVIWPDSCMGVYRPDALCAQALLRGYLAILVDLGTGTTYEYHGSGEIIVPAFALAEGWRVGEPAPIDPYTFPG
jgi:hypothetical protein